MTAQPGLHCLTDAELSALARVQFTAAAVRELATAECSKHLLLLEALRRASTRPGAAGHTARVADAVAVLSEVQIRAPGVLTGVLALPNFGMWAADCLTWLGTAAGLPRNAADAGQADAVHLSGLSGFAAVAALRAGHPCELTLPVRAGTVHFPATGVARVGPAGMRGWARLTIDRHGATLTAPGAHAVTVPAGGSGRPARGGDWRPVRRLRVRSQGITLEVIFDDADPFLARLGPRAAEGSGPELRAWRHRLGQAWRILTRRYRSTALGLAAGLTTLVPLQGAGHRRPLSATSGLAWGAIALSLPPDSLSLAEALFHEFQHLVLAAVDDVRPLLRSDGGPLRYAPWRDDPRPADGLIQGTYAYLGMAGFWRQQRRRGRHRHRMRGWAEFARSRRGALEAAFGLAESAALSETGQSFNAAMIECLTGWQREPVPAAAEAMACEAAAEHRLRWRLSHLSPDEHAIDSLASAWAAGVTEPPGATGTPTTLVPWTRSWRDNRSELLTLRYRDSRQLARQLREPGMNAADAALLRGDADGAREGYLREIRSGSGPGAWIGLILARRRQAGRCADWVVTERPEVIVAVYERAAGLTGTLPDPDSLITWLTPTP